MNENMQVLPPDANRNRAVAHSPGISGVNVGELIAQAIANGTGVEVMKELRAMAMEDQKIRAEAAFDAALSEFQAECPVIGKNKAVTDNSGGHLYSYAPFEEIVSMVKPLLQKHGFNYTLDTDVESKDGWVIAKCLVTHNMGAKRESVAKFPLGGGTRAMSTTQVFAAALSFASRRVFCNAFGIITGNEDKDGAGPKAKFQAPDGKPQPPAQTYDDDANKRMLVDMTRSVHGLPRGYKLDEVSKQKLTQYLVDEALIADTQTVSDLHGASLAGLIEKLKTKQRGR